MLSEFADDIERNYNIIPKVIAHGAYGFIQEGYRKSDNKHVAIKTLSDEISDYTQSLHLLRELRILAKVDHPRCLCLLGFNLNPRPRIVTPFMSNGTLFNALIKKDENFTPTKRMCSIYGICSTMQYLHENSIIHRDFKPANVFLDDNYDICIADFGLSRIVEQDPQMTMAKLGSPIYMAPEVFAVTSENYTNKIDVYSFGVTYYQYFTLKCILDDKNTEATDPSNLLRRIAKNARFIKPDEMNKNQFKIYKICTNEDPHKRPSFAELCNIFELNESIWIEGTNKEVFLNYINDCKILSQKNKPIEKSNHFNPKGPVERSNFPKSKNPAERSNFPNPKNQHERSSHPKPMNLNERSNLPKLKRRKFFY